MGTYLRHYNVHVYTCVLQSCSILHPTTTSLQRTLIGLCRDLRGIAYAFNNKTSYMMLFDWMYPSLYMYIVYTYVTHVVHVRIVVVSLARRILPRCGSLTDIVYDLAHTFIPLQHYIAYGYCIQSRPRIHTCTSTAYIT